MHTADDSRQHLIPVDGQSYRQFNTKVPGHSSDGGEDSKADDEQYELSQSTGLLSSPVTGITSSR